MSRFTEVVFEPSFLELFFKADSYYPQSFEGESHLATETVKYHLALHLVGHLHLLLLLKMCDYKVRRLILGLGVRLLKALWKQLRGGTSKAFLALAACLLEGSRADSPRAWTSGRPRSLLDSCVSALWSRVLGPLSASSWSFAKWS